MFENLTEKLQRAFKNLRGQGTLTEENIQEALNVLERENVDLVLTDLRLGGEDGRSPRGTITRQGPLAVGLGYNGTTAPASTERTRWMAWKVRVRARRWGMVRRCSRLVACFWMG